MPSPSGATAPDPFFPSTEPCTRSRQRTRRLGLAIVVVAAVVAGGVAVAASQGDDGPAYRTAIAGRHDVDQTLDLVGTVEPVSQATVAFPVAGSVATVDVAVGDSVAVGQRLATLDTTELERTLVTKQAALDQAELTLAKELAGESVASTGGSGAPTGGTGSTARTATAKAATATTATSKAAAPPSTAALAAAVQAAARACASTTPPPSTTTTTTTTTTSTTVPADTTTTTTTTAPTPTGGASSSQACTDALAAVEAAQADLEAALARQAATPTTTPVTPSIPGGTTGTGTTGTPGIGTGTGTSTSSAPSAADLVAAQKAVDAAELAVAVAEQAIDQATIVSPIAGTVVDANLAVDDTVTAASSTANIVVSGSGGYEVTTQVDVADLPDVATGQAASVTVDGTRRARTGKVVAIGLVADTSGSTTTYPVVIGLTGDTSGLGNGATASVVLTTDSQRAALAVPTSAVTTTGTRSIVQVLEDGVARAVTVEVGAVGATWTEITDGIDAGAVVVLADLAEPLPGSATSSSNGSSSNGRTGFPGGGSFPGGGAFPVGGPPGN